MPDGLQLLKMDGVSKMKSDYSTDTFRLCSVIQHSSPADSISSDLEIWSQPLTSQDIHRLIELLPLLDDKANWPMQGLSYLFEVSLKYKGRISLDDLYFMYGCIFQPISGYSCYNISQIRVIPISATLDIL